MSRLPSRQRLRCARHGASARKRCLGFCGSPVRARSCLAASGLLVPPAALRSSARTECGKPSSSGIDFPEPSWCSLPILLWIVPSFGVTGLLQITGRQGIVRESRAFDDAGATLCQTPLILCRIMSRQLEINFRKHGGRRLGAGRKPDGDSALVSHAKRASFKRPSPVHVTLEVRREIPNLRAAARFRAIRQAFIGARGRNGMRLSEFNVLGDHLHLIVEADNSSCLSRGLQGLCVRLTRALNRVAGRRGGVFADRFHSRLLRTPTELVRAIAYVIDNARHHFGRPDASCSSRASDAQESLETPRGWLLRVGWKKARLHDRIAPTVANIDLLSEFMAVS